MKSFFGHTRKGAFTKYFNFIKGRLKKIAFLSLFLQQSTFMHIHSCHSSSNILMILESIHIHKHNIQGKNNNERGQRNSQQDQLQTRITRKTSICIEVHSTYMTNTRKERLFPSQCIHQTPPYKAITLAPFSSPTARTPEILNLKTKKGRRRNKRGSLQFL